uniref:Acetyl-CoA acetyltransferase, mitochondrial n=1 Tax=Cacopsylla melanoneura TaxID=428564 RepID=A0A8D8QSG5_9HEMI
MNSARILRSWIGEVYLASCVRTPLGRYNGSLKHVTDSRLGAIVIDSVLQRSAIDKTNVDHVLIETNDTAMRDMMSFAGLSDTTNYSIVCGCNGLKSIAPAIDLLTSGGVNVTVSGGTSTWSDQDYTKCIELLNQNIHTKNAYLRGKYLCAGLTRLEKAKKNGCLLEETQPIIIPGHPRLNRSPVTLIEDESEVRNPQDGPLGSFVDGAAACVLTTKHFLSDIKVSPIGIVSSLVEASSPEQSAKSILEANNLSQSDIDLWQINDISFDSYHRTLSELHINEDRVNIHSGTAIMGYNAGMSGLHNMIQLVQSLKPNQKGIVVHGTFESAMSILIEKLPVKSNFITPQKKPVLTLYTKDPCPLCDELKLELAPYIERVHLEEVYLTPESYWYKLYRYEIPVLFLGGRFVCRNKFDSRVFEKILRDIEDELQ